MLPPVQGLFPRSLSSCKTEEAKSRVLELFTFMGTFVAKAMQVSERTPRAHRRSMTTAACLCVSVCVWGMCVQDRRPLDLPLSATFCARLRGDAASLDDVRHVKPFVHKVLLKLRDIDARHTAVDVSTTLAAGDRDLALMRLREEVDAMVRCALVWCMVVFSYLYDDAPRGVSSRLISRSPVRTARPLCPTAKTSP